MFCQLNSISGILKLENREFC